MRADAQNLQAITRAISQHNKTCEYPATAVRMAPFEVERLGWDEVLGLPIISDDSMGTGSFQIDCGKPDGSPEENVEAEEEVLAPAVGVPVAA